MVLGFVLAEHQKLRHETTEPRDHRLPLRMRSAYRMAAGFSTSLGLWAQAASSDAFRASVTVNDDRSMRLVKGASVPT